MTSPAAPTDRLVPTPAFDTARLIASSSVLLVGALAVSFTFGVGSGYIDAYVFFLALSLFVAVWMRGSATETIVLITLAFAARVALGHVLPEWIVFDDEKGYERTGRAVMNALENGEGVDWASNPYGGVAGLLFYLFGADAHTAKAFNSFLGIVGALYLERIARHFPSKTPLGQATLLFGLFFPANVFLSAVALKEQLVATELIACLYFALRSRRSTDLLWAFGVLIAMVPFRSSLALPLIAVLAVAIFVRAAATGGLSKGVTVAVSTGVLLAATGSMSYLMSDVVMTTKIAMIATGLDERGESTLAESDATVASYLDTDNLFGPRNIVVAIARSVFSPSPFVLFKDQRAQQWAEVVLLTLWWYLAVPPFVWTAWAYRHNFSAQLTVVFFGVVFLSASLAILTFSPETFRYRWSGLPLFFWLALLGAREGGVALRPFVAAWAVLVLAFGYFYVGA